MTTKKTILLQIAIIVSAILFVYAWKYQIFITNASLSKNTFLKILYPNRDSNSPINPEASLPINNRDRISEIEYPTEPSTADIEQKLSQETTDLEKECSSLKNKICENSIHHQLFLNRGYTCNSPEILKLLNENKQYSSVLVDKYSRLRDLQAKLSKVQRIAAESGRISERQGYNPDFDPEYYMWQQKYRQNEDNLLTFNMESSVSEIKDMSEVENRIIKSLSGEGQKKLRSCNVVIDTQLPYIKLSNYMELPGCDRQVLEKEFKSIQGIK